MLGLFKLLSELAIFARTWFQLHVSPCRNSLDLRHQDYNEFTKLVTSFFCMISLSRMTLMVLSKIPTEILLKPEWLRKKVSLTTLYFSYS